METLGLGRYVGQSPEVVMAAIANALAPEGSTREEAIARRAVNDALRELYQTADGTGSLEAFQSLTGKEVVGAITTAVTSCIYRRWLSDLGLKIEEKAISRSQAVKLERQVKKFVRDAVRFELKAKDVLSMNWKGRESRDVMQRIYTEAYGFLGGGL
jgi:hypothetical protein